MKVVAKLMKNSLKVVKIFEVELVSEKSSVVQFRSFKPLVRIHGAHERSSLGSKAILDFFDPREPVLLEGVRLNGGISRRERAADVDAICELALLVPFG